MNVSYPLVGSVTYSDSLIGSHGVSPFKVTAETPEPATVALTEVVLVVAGILRRRRRAS